jgi:hypothetical protein
MTLAIDAYPLAWPVGWKRTPALSRRRSGYRVDFSKARDELVREVNLLGAQREDIVISSNMMLRRDGFPLASQREPEDPGIAIYWAVRKWNGGANHVQQRVIACDVWRTIRENLRAIGLAVGALRMLERTGASEILERAYTGFAALPPAASSESWRAVFSWTDADRPTEADIEERYRAMAKFSHPDVAGGSHEAMIRLNKAREEALAWVLSQ